MKMSDVFGGCIDTTITDGSGYDVIGIYGPDDRLIRSLDDEHANAIDAAVNNHDALVEALERLTQGYDSEELAHHFGIDGESALSVINALNKAKGNS